MPIYPQTQSNLVNPATNNNRTGVALSTQILIKVGDVPVGGVQSLSINENREIAMISEVSTDGAIDSAPTRSSEFSGTCRRVRFDRLRITESMTKGFLHVHSQRIPFDITILDFWSGNGANTIITTLKNVWITSLSYDYNVDNWLIYDTMNWKCESISSTINGGPAATGGERGAGILALNSVERAADIGTYRGSMDQPGLITDYFSNL